MDDPGSTLIPTRSRRQAMDWSLVLASQAIDCTILQSPEDGRWTLLVALVDHARAVATLEQYRLENRGWRWRRELPWPELTFHWGSLIWWILVAVFYGLSADPLSAMREQGSMDNLAVGKGQWWRLATAVTLHADPGHLMANLAVGFLVLGLVMARYGPGIGLLAAYLAGLGGNLTGLLFYPHPYRGVGASGMVMGALGLLAVHSFSLWRRSPRAARFILSGVGTGFMLFVLIGLDPTSDVVAHLGGFLSGMLLGGMLALAPDRRLQNGRLNLALSLLLGGLVILTWALALR